MFAAPVLVVFHPLCIHASMQVPAVFQFVCSTWYHPATLTSFCCVCVCVCACVQVWTYVCACMCMCVLLRLSGLINILKFKKFQLSYSETPPSIPLPNRGKTARMVWRRGSTWPGIHSHRNGGGGGDKSGFKKWVVLGKGLKYTEMW